MWNDKVVIITGSSIGIGRRLALEIGKRGGRVVINARNKDRLNQTCTDLKLKGLEISACQGDVSIFEDCKKIVEHSVNTYGKIDLLINNAGICSKANLEEIEPNVFKKILDVNLLGSVYMTKVTLPFIKLTTGSIFFVGSIASIHGLGDYSAYCSSKSALKTLVESLRIELYRTGIYVGLANVGFTENDPKKTFLDKNGKSIAVPSRDAIRQEPVNNVALRLMRMIEQRKVVSTFSLMGKISEIVSRFSPLLVHRVLLNSYMKNQY